MARRQKKTSKSTTNTLRIIGGQWRSRKLSFSDAEGLRPTPDRIRETLFNWLQNDIHGATCLDLFAGSGALGFEALSRGAGHVTFVEKNKIAANQLKSNLELLKANKSEAEVYQDDALEFLQKNCEPSVSETTLEQSDDDPKGEQSESKWGGVLNIIFLDPPYRKGLLEKSLNLLQEKALISPDTLIYLEHESEDFFDWSDYGLATLKEANAGQVKCYLLGGIS